jgi:hypothetical protein
MVKGSRMNKKTLGSLAENRKLMALFFFALFAIGIVISFGGGFGAQNIYGYNERTFNSQAIIVINNNPAPAIQHLYQLNDLAALANFPSEPDGSKAIDQIRVYIFGGSDLTATSYSCRIRMVTLDEETMTIPDNTILDVSPSATVVSEGGQKTLTWWYTNKINLLTQSTRVFMLEISLTRKSDNVVETYQYIFDVIPSNPDMNLVGPSDATYTVGNTITPLTWSWNTAIVGTTTIEVIDVDTFTTNASNWTLPNNLLPTIAGTHIINVKITDPYNRIFTDSVTITLESAEVNQLISLISVPDDITFEYHNGAHVLAWQFSGAAQDVIYVGLVDNGVNIYSYAGIYSNTFTYSVSDFVVGTHQVVLSMIDANEFEYTDTVIVTVLPIDLPPVLSHPADISFKIGDAVPTIIWNVNEPVTAIVTRTGHSTATYYPDYVSGQIKVICNDLEVGDYDFKIAVTDTGEHTVEDTVHVIVHAADVVGDVTSPTITGPTAPIENIGIGSISGNIVWTITDESEGSYTIYREKVSVATGSWSSGDTITYSFSESDYGSYLYEITAVDDAGNEASAAVMVLVNALPATVPVQGFDIQKFLTNYGVYIGIGLVGVLIISFGLTRRRKVIAMPIRGMPYVPK